MDNPVYDSQEDNSSAGAVKGRDGRKSTISASPPTPKVTGSLESGCLPEEVGQEGGARLRRAVGGFSGTAIAVGSIIGSGIFISPKGVLRGSGSVGLSLVVWLVCGVYSFLQALCYIELGLLLPEAGGDYAYLLRGLGPLHPFLGPLPAFLESWTSNLVRSPALVAVLSLAFAEYCVQPFFSLECDPPPEAISLIAAATCCLVVFINCCSMTWVTRVQNFFTMTKLTTIAIIVACGVYSLSLGNTQHLESGFEGSATSASDIASAFFSGLFSFGGWQLLNNLTEEIRDPARNLPLAIFAALAVVTSCYVLTNVAYLTVLSPRQLLSSPAVAFSFGERVLGPAAFLMPVGVAFSVFGSLNGCVLGTSRVAFASARQGHFPSVLSFVHVRRLTPVPALLFRAALAVVMIGVGNIGILIRLMAFVRSFFQVLVMISLLVMRRTMADARRPYRVPLVIPCLVMLVSAYLVISPLVDRPQVEYIYVTLFVAVGVLTYVPFVHCKWTPPFMKHVTLWLQKAVELVPTANPRK